MSKLKKGGPKQINKKQKILEWQGRFAIADYFKKIERKTNRRNTNNKKKTQITKKENT